MAKSFEIDLGIPDDFFDPIEALPVGGIQGSLVKEIDNYLFSSGGIIPQKINEQNWAPLDADYVRRKIQQGYDDRIWVRTGRTLDAVNGSGDKQVSSDQNALVSSGKDLYTGNIAIDYVSFPDDLRPLLTLTEEEGEPIDARTEEAFLEILDKKLEQFEGKKVS